MKTNITIELNPINCGIYGFRHIETGLAYVGSAIDVRTRVAKHFKDLSKGRHHSKKAQELYDTSPTGNCAFEVRVIESCSVAEMDDLEDSYIESGDYALNVRRAKYGRMTRRGVKTPKPVKPRGKAGRPRVEKTEAQKKEENRKRVARHREKAKAKAAEAAAHQSA
jgi:group I intron endonuclease